MCSPTIALTAIKIAIPIMGYMATRSAAKAQEEALLAGQAEMDREYDEQRLELEKTAMADKAKEKIEKIRAMGAERAASAEGGFMGLLSQQRMQDIAAAAGLNLGTIEAERRRGQKQINRNQRASRNQTQGELNAVEQPNLVSTALEVGAAYYSGKAGTPDKKISSYGQRATGKSSASVANLGHYQNTVRQNIATKRSVSPSFMGKSYAIR